MQTQQIDASPRSERLSSVGSVIVAFLASQHHSLHMLLMFGLGGAGMGLMTTDPTVRRVMLLVSLGMAGVTAYLLIRHRPPRARLVMNVLSIVLTLSLVVWSISQFGL